VDDDALCDALSPVEELSAFPWQAKYKTLIAMSVKAIDDATRRCVVCKGCRANYYPIMVQTQQVGIKMSQSTTFSKKSKSYAVSGFIRSWKPSLALLDAAAKGQP